MNRLLQPLVFAAGLAAIGWVGVGYIGHHPLALAITVLIGVFYVIGALELRHYQHATLGLSDALQGLNESPAGLGPWLDRLDASLQNAVRLRIEGERVGLPGPALTPYLAGLLVLLGMLGTFVGMVVTLKGTGIALESATDLLAIRSSLAAPVRGLGLAFGTSLAGVGASAMLGLVSALCRRDRARAAQLLDMRIAGGLRVFSLAHCRDESFRLLKLQTELMPQLVDRLQDMMLAMERQGQALNGTLIANQDAFHGKAEAAYRQLASSVDQSLRESLADSARLAGETIQPVVETTMAGIAREASALHDELAQTFGQRSAALLDGISTRFEGTVDHVTASWRGALDQQGRTAESLMHDTHRALASAAATFEQHAAALIGTVRDAHADQQALSVSTDTQRLAAWTQALESMAASLRAEWQQAGVQAAELQQDICRALEQSAERIHARTQAHAQDTIAEVARLVDAASEAPRAAAEVIAELRQKLSDSMVRDNAMLDERTRILQTLATLLDAVNHASGEQRAAIDGLVSGLCTGWGSPRFRLRGSGQ